MKWQGLNTIRVGTPDFVDSWPRYHAAVGSYQYGAVQRMRRDLLRLKDAWLRLDPTKTLPEASWLQTAVAATEQMLDELIPYGIYTFLLRSRGQLKPFIFKLQL